MPLLRAGAALAAVLMVAACGSASPAARRAVGRRVHRRLRRGRERGRRRRRRRSPRSSDPADADPHEYEPTPADALAVSRATVFVANGGGYDDFATKLYDAASNKPIERRRHARCRASTPTPPTSTSTSGTTSRRSRSSPTTSRPPSAPPIQPNANRYLDNAKKFDAQVDGLMTKVAAIKAKHAGAKVAITEPVPGYLLDAAGLVVVTPPEFSEAVEEGTDPPAAVVTANNATFAEAKVARRERPDHGPDHHPGRAGRRGATACPSSRSPRRCPKA